MHDEADVSWFKVCDGFPQHPKLDNYSGRELAEMTGVWVLCGSDASFRKTDGFVARERVRKLFGDEMSKPVERLVACGLWEVVDGGWRFHDFLDYNPSAQQRKDAAQANAERQKAHREREKKGESANSNALRYQQVTRDMSVSNASPVPSRPDPIRSRESSDARAREEQASIQDAARIVATFGKDWAGAAKKLEEMWPRLRRLSALSTPFEAVETFESLRVTQPALQPQRLLDELGPIDAALIADGKDRQMSARDALDKIRVFVLRTARNPQPHHGVQPPRGAPHDPEAERRAANEAERAAKARRERAAPSPAPTPEERAKNAELAKAARAAVTQVGRLATTRSRAAHPEPIAPTAGALASMAEVDAAAAERGRAEARRLAEWEAAEQQRKAVAT